MTVLAVIGDVHARGRKLRVVVDHLATVGVDGVLLVGDLGSSLPPRQPISGSLRERYLRAVGGMLKMVGELEVPLAYVPGNHDLPDLDLPGNADGRLVDVAGVSVFGIGGSPDFRGDPYEWTEDAVRAREIAESEVLLAHCPPARTPLDRVPRRGAHVGSEAIRELAAARGGALVCGHIHESPGACRIGDALCLNVGGLGRPYGKSQVGFLHLESDGWRAGHRDLEADTERWWTLADAPDATEGWSPEEDAP